MLSKVILSRECIIKEVIIKELKEFKGFINELMIK